MFLMLDNICLYQIRVDGNFDFVSLYESELDIANDNLDSPYKEFDPKCEVYTPDQFAEMTNDLEKLHTRSYFHLNCRGLSVNWESFKELMCDLQRDDFYCVK